MSTNLRKRSSRRGSILLLAIFFLIVLFSLSVAFFRIIPAEFHSASHSRRGIQANYAADSGVRQAVAWLKYEWNANQSHIISPTAISGYNVKNFGSHSDDYGIDDWPTLTANDPKLEANRLDAEWSSLSRIRMDDTDFFRRIYVIESCSYFRGRPVTVTKSTVQNESFARFALMYSKWDDGFIYSMNPNGIQGPVHTNDFFRLSAGTAAYWNATKSNGEPEDPWVSGKWARMTQAGRFASDSTTPVNTLGLAGDGIQYANGNSYSSNLGLVPYTNTGSPIADRYDKIVKGGRENIKQVQEIPMPSSVADLREQAWGGAVPTNTAQWNTALAGANNVLVQTTSGHPNDPTGKVKGGIFIRNQNASDVLLDLTPEGHQKIRVRQGSLAVPDPDNTTYWANIPEYRYPIEHPARQEETTVCTGTRTVMVDDWRQVTKSQEKTEANAGRCGTHKEYIAGEGGVSQPIDVPNICTFTETWTEWEKTGTQHPEQQCNAWGPGQPINYPAWTEWVVTKDSSIDGAVPNNTFSREKVNSDYPGAEPQVGTRNIENWNSVVEVNDSNYKIPYHSGMKINGEVITNSNDSRLTVADGHTVSIKNDFADSKGDYAEYTVMEGRVNGVVFSDVSLYGVRGTAKGSKYTDKLGNLSYQGKVLAANIQTDKDIEIRDSILQYYDGNEVGADGQPLKDDRNRLKPGATSPNSDHILGMIGRNISIKPTGKSNTYENSRTAKREGNQNNTHNVSGKPFRGGYFSGGINVYSVLMAGKVATNGTVTGGFGSHDSAMDADDNMGDFNLFGGIISATARKTQWNRGGNNHGFRLGLNYDPVAAEELQYFPPTNDFRVLRYVTYKANED